MERFLHIIPLLLALAGCATVPAPEPVKPVEPAKPAEAPAAVDTKPEPVQAQVVPKVEERKPVERIVEEKFFLLSRETTVYPDGSVSDVTAYSYAKDSLLLLKKETRDSHKILLETTEYEYEGDRAVRVTARDGGGKLKSQRLSTYTPEGLLDSETLSGKDGKTASVSRYDYDVQGNRIRWSVYDGAKLLLGVTNYVFQDGRNVRMDIVNAAGKPERSVSLDYQDGFKVRETYRMPSGETDKYTVYAWKEGRPVSESVYGASDKPVSRIEYAFDGNGNMVSTRTYDRTGTLTQTRNREYEERTITHVVRE
jgi:YD repeat-containing protein